MEQIKYYLDEHIHSAVAEGLRRRGDSDYLVLAAEGVPNAGIAYANRKRTVGELIAALMLLRDVLTPEEMVNHVEYL